MSIKVRVRFAPVDIEMNGMGYDEARYQAMAMVADMPIDIRNLKAEVMETVQGGFEDQPEEIRTRHTRTFHTTGDPHSVVFRERLDLTGASSPSDPHRWLTSAPRPLIRQAEEAASRYSAEPMSAIAHDSFDLFGDPTLPRPRVDDGTPPEYVPVISTTTRDYSPTSVSWENCRACSDEVMASFDAQAGDEVSHVCVDDDDADVAF